MTKPGRMSIRHKVWGCWFGQDFPGRYEQIKDEWRLNTRKKLQQGQQGDPAAYALFTDPKYRLPTVEPDGKYCARKLTIQKYP